ncbi:MAG: M14 metallopeptidase family protein [Planctomycetota bacterium]
MIRLPRILTLGLMIGLSPGVEAQQGPAIPPLGGPVRALRSPEEALGNPIGADGFLADYTALRSYWSELADASDRMSVESIGTTSYGQDHIAAILSSPRNLARLSEIRETNVRLALGRDEDESVAAQLANRDPAVIWIDAGLHATESIAGQNILELVWQMVSRDDEEVRRILDHVVLIACPANPDGMEMVARGYMATGQIGRLPVLYQRFVGHDNNRDHYAANQPEARNVSRMLYREWLPQVIYNHHQTAPRGTILFTPPFRDPFNYNIDPLVIRGIELVSAHMNHRFSSEGKPGVISRSGASYSTWWNGGLRTAAYFHNQIGILTEAFGSPDPVEIRQTLNRRLPYSDYPDPVPTQIWHARQTIDYLQTANFAILDLASRFPARLKLDQWRMARRQVAKGSKDHWTATPKLLEIARDRAAKIREGEEVRPAFEDPELRDARHFVLSRGQPDFNAAVRLVRCLRRTGVEVRRLTAPVDLGFQGEAPIGSFVIDAAQAFRPQVLDMLEPQWHPDDLDSGDPVRPYDSSGWTLSMQMGVEVIRVREALEYEGEWIDEVEIAFPAADLPKAQAGWLIDCRDSNAAILVNRLGEVGVEVSVVESPLVIDGGKLPPGAFFIPNSTDAVRVLETGCGELGLECIPLDGAPSVSQRPIGSPRVGVLDVYGGHMATGWTSWALGEFEFDYEVIHPFEVENGDVSDRFDVLLIATGLPPTSERARREQAFRRSNSVVDEELVQKLQAALPPFEDWSGIGAWPTPMTVDVGVANLREFVEQGGRICAFGDAAARLVDLFELPIRKGLLINEEGGSTRPVSSAEWFVPGSLLALDVDLEHPLGFGVADGQVAMFRRSPVFWSEESDRARVIASYASTGELLRSGWAIGADRMRGGAAIMDVPLGRGSVTLFGPDVMYRGQPIGTFRFLFNAIRSGSR